jgi:DNA-binding transcriptional LysR family regulator
MVVALPANHSCAVGQDVDLGDLRADPFLLFPRPVSPTLYDSIIGACREAGFDPVIGQVAPHMASIVTLVAAELGVSIVPASMSQLHITGVVYRAIAGEAPKARLGLAYRRGDTSPIVRNFIAQAVA